MKASILSTSCICKGHRHRPRSLIADCILDEQFAKLVSVSDRQIARLILAHGHIKRWIPIDLRLSEIQAHHLARCGLVPPHADLDRLSRSQFVTPLVPAIEQHSLVVPIRIAAYEDIDAGMIRHSYDRVAHDSSSLYSGG